MSHLIFMLHLWLERLHAYIPDTEKFLFAVNFAINFNSGDRIRTSDHHIYMNIIYIKLQKKTSDHYLLNNFCTEHVTLQLKLWVHKCSNNGV